ncbi:MAG TPA: hypothetical protein VIC25_09250 [Caulobacteraceae bacterium]
MSPMRHVAGTAALALLATAAVAAPLGGRIAAQSPSPPMRTPGAMSPAPSKSDTPSSTANTGTAENTSASAANLSVGMTVNDNTGAAIGPITALTSGANGMATIKMGEQSFQVPATNLYMSNGSATINLTRAQLQAQLPKPPA